MNELGLARLRRHARWFWSPRNWSWGTYSCRRLTGRTVHFVDLGPLEIRWETGPDRMRGIT